MLNLVDGRRSAGALRDAVAAIYGPVPLELVDGYLATLEKLGLLACDGREPWDWQLTPTEPLAARAPDFPPPADPAELAAAGYAKIVCSAVFVSGREPDEARRNSALLFFPDAGSRLEVTVDREKRRRRRLRILDQPPAAVPAQHRGPLPQQRSPDPRLPGA